MELPNELIDEVLTRVPVKYLLRCRCVSKGWCSVIDSNVFVKKYLKMSVERNRVGLMIHGHCLNYDPDKKYLLADLVSLEDGSAAIDISEEVGGVLRGARMVNSANGLVCLSLLYDKRNLMFLLNPSTRKCKKLPVVDNYSLDEYYLCGFGYDCVSDDYKVVLIEKRKGRSGIIVNVYSLKKNAWTPISNDFSTENLLLVAARVTCVDGAVVWTLFDSTSYKFVNVGFDLNLEQFSEAEVCNWDVRLSDISIESSCAKEILANPAFGRDKYPRSVAYLKSLEKILFEMHCKNFMWYDIRSKTLKNVSLSWIPNEFISRTYIESLFPLIEDI